jgi:hypothetical protein
MGVNQIPFLPFHIFWLIYLCSWCLCSHVHAFVGQRSTSCLPQCFPSVYFFETRFLTISRVYQPGWLSSKSRDSPVCISNSTTPRFLLCCTSQLKLPCLSHRHFPISLATYLVFLVSHQILFLLPLN